MTFEALEKEAKEDYKRLERITKSAKNREEILGIANAWMEQAILLNDIARWSEEAVQKIASDKAEEVMHYVSAELEADAIRHMPQYRDAKIGQATEE